MIGINIRGFRHLWRLADSHIKEVMINFKDYGYCFCHVIKTDKSSPMGETLAIFNNQYNCGKRSINEYLNKVITDENEIRYISNNYSRVIALTNYRFGDEFPYIYDVVLLPDSFEEDYSKFLSSNAKMIRTLTNKFGYDVNQPFSKRAFMYSDGSKNFYQWAISAYFQNNTSMASIRRIMYWNEVYGQMTKKLKKNTITAYTSRDDISSLLDEMTALRTEKRINDVINMFNTAQKKILRSKTDSFSDKDKETLSRFYRLSEAKKVNFIRKMSTIEDYDEIMRQMRHATSAHFDWNKDSFMDFISNVEGIKYETILDNGNIVLVKVDDYETVKYLAKTTNWCISKNKTYWNQYVEHNADSTQYMIFDFSKKEDDLLSIIGFTTEYNKGITHAHDFSNNDIMGSNDRIQDMNFLNTFISNFSSSNGIYDILKECNIDINIIAKYEKPLFEWDKDSMFSYLYECVNKYNVDVLCDNGNLVAISVTDSNIRYFLGDAYIDNIPDSNWPLQHIIFMDFSMNAYDPNRIVFAIIGVNTNIQEDFCMFMYNEHMEPMNCVSSFNYKLSQYGLPYDVIRRTDNISEKIKSAFMSYNAPLLNNLLHQTSEETVKDIFNNYVEWDMAGEIIISSVTKYMSFDIIDAFYNNGFRFSTLFDTSMVSSIINNILASMISHCSAIGGDYKIPTQDQIKKFLHNECCDSIDEAFYIGTYLTMKRIIKTEGETNVPRKYNMYKGLLSTIIGANKKGDAIEDLLMDIEPQLDFSDKNRVVSGWLNYARFCSEKMKKMAISNALKYEASREIWDSLSDDSQNVVNTLEHPDDLFETFGFNDEPVEADDYYGDDIEVEAL